MSIRISGLGLLMATLKNSIVNDTGYFTLPSGTTAQRPVTPVTGMVRFNTTLGYAEVYNGNTWVKFGL
jgi:hypothetical protein